MIDEKRIIKNLEEFSFPRLSGTEFEKKSFNIAKNKIENLNLTPKIQEFSFSTFYSRVYPKVSLILLNWLLLVLFLNIQVIFSIINLFLILIFIFGLIILTRNPEEIKLGRIHQSQNLFIQISSQSNVNCSNNNFILFSHLDSKGQSISIKIRILLYYIWITSFPFSLITIIINSFFLEKSSTLFYIFAVIFLIINCTATIILLLNITNNKSKGAIDNASGICCVLELLHYFSHSENRLKNINLSFVFTGAEESGTMGVRNYYKNIKDYDRNNTFIINFDSIAQKVNLWDHGLINNKHSKSFNYILENKDLLNLEKARRIYIGTYSDGLFLLNKKFKGLGNGDKGSYKYIHSVNDDVDKIDTKILKLLCEFYITLLKESDNDLFKLSKSAD